jgi:hypothetical protein
MHQDHQQDSGKEGIGVLIHRERVTQIPAGTVKSGAKPQAKKFSSAERA